MKPSGHNLDWLSMKWLYLTKSTSHLSDFNSKQVMKHINLCE